MTVSRATLIYNGLRRLGGRTGAISSGTATTAVLGGLINTTGDDRAYAAKRLFMLEAANETDKERLIDSWVDLTGTATFATRADSTYTNELYGISNREDYTLAEYRSALSKALTYTRRSYRHIVPMTPNLMVYPLSSMAWLEGAGDIDAVWLNTSPIMLHNEDFGLWQNGGSLAPDGWTLAGASATIARSATGIRSAYGATVARVGNDATLYQSVPPSLVQYMTRRTGVNFIPWQVGAWAVSSTANIGRVGIYNGSTTTWSAYHSGNGAPQWLTASYTPTGAETDCRIVLSTDTTNGAVTWHAGALLQNADMPTSVRDMGSQAYDEIECNYAQRNTGGLPVVELQPYSGFAGQLVVYSRRPFADMTSDADVCEDEFARVIEAGMLVWLLDSQKPNHDRARLDRILNGGNGDMGERARWVRFLNNATSKPPARPVVQAVVYGA